MERVVFENSTSPLYYSNDTRLDVRRENTTVPAGWVVVDSTDNHVELFTLKREIADTYVAGYDYCERLARDKAFVEAARERELQKAAQELGIELP